MYSIYQDNMFYSRVIVTMVLPNQFQDCWPYEQATLKRGISQIRALSRNLPSMRWVLQVGSITYFVDSGTSRLKFFQHHASIQSGSFSQANVEKICQLLLCDFWDGIICSSLVEPYENV